MYCIYCVRAPQSHSIRLAPMNPHTRLVSAGLMSAKSIQRRILKRTLLRLLNTSQFELRIIETAVAVVKSIYLDF